MATKNPKSLLCRLLYQKALGILAAKYHPVFRAPAWMIRASRRLRSSCVGSVDEFVPPTLNKRSAHRLGSSELKIVPEALQVSPHRLRARNRKNASGRTAGARARAQARRDKSLICIGTRQMNARRAVAAEKNAVLLREYRDGIS
jgi:hypothetical protein